MARLRIAINGGGIASLCLAHALTSQHSEFEVQIFEASPSFRHESAALGLSYNAQTALTMLSPSLREALDEAGGVPMEPSVRLYMGTGPDQGQHIGDIQSAIPQLVVHRGSLWKAFHKRIPDGILNMGKKLVNIEHANDNLRMQFDDGSYYEADALIGCDGINSIVRSAVLGSDHPALVPEYARGYSHYAIVPMETAVAFFGDDYCSERTQKGWVGEKGLLVTDVVDRGASMQVVASFQDREPWKYSTPVVEWSKDKLKNDLANWGNVGQAMIQIFIAQPVLFGVGSRYHPETPTYCKDNICIAGDAALTFPPSKGAGAGQAIEDSLMLSTVLGVCKSKEDFAHAFKIYDALRRPRRSAIAEASREASLILTGCAPGIGLDMNRLAEQLPGWSSLSHNYDLANAQAEALKGMMEAR